MPAVKTVIPKRTTNLIAFSIIIILFSCIGIISANFAFMVTDKIYQGVFIGGLSAGGLSIDEAREKVTTAYQTKLKNKPVLTIKYNGISWTIWPDEIDLMLDPSKTALQAYEVGRSGALIERLQERYHSINSGVSVPFSVSYNQEKLTNLIHNIVQSINKEPQNATISINGTSIQIIPETKGLAVDFTKLLLECDNKIHTTMPDTINLDVEIKEPAIIQQDLQHIDSIISVFTTEFDPNNANRSQNIYLAAKSLSGLLVKNNEVISFNKLVGPRIEEYGFKEAPVFIEGKIVPDWGGGVCQVSSTLYNAILLADLEIEERTPHFRPPAYVPLGRDATVADNLLDFKFKNTLPNPIFITAKIDGSQLMIYVLGKHDSNAPEIRIVTTDSKVIEPNTIIKQDPSLDLGKRVIEIAGQKGIEITTHRVRMINNTEINRDFLAFDEYKPEDRVIRVGTKIPANGK